MKLVKQSNYNSTDNPVQQEGKGARKARIEGPRHDNDMFKKFFGDRDEMEVLQNYAKAADTDLINIFTAFKGRIRFGDATDGYRGENMSGEFRTFTSSATANASTTLTHTLESVPVGRIIINQDKAGSLYAGTGTSTTTTIPFKCDVASVTFTMFLLK
jgi:hypothetical protein